MDNGTENKNTNKIYPLARGRVLGKIGFWKKVDNGNSSSSNREDENTKKICPLARENVLRKVGFWKKSG